MPRGHCHRHGAQHGPCSCGLGRMSRLVEPIVLSLLARGEARYGYEITGRANKATLTDSAVDDAAVYRALRALEQAGCVVSQWQPGVGGPRRRAYEITDLGRQHLKDWLTVLDRHIRVLRDFVASHPAD